MPLPTREDLSSSYVKGLDLWNGSKSQTRIELNTYFVCLRQGIKDVHLPSESVFQLLAGVAYYFQSFAPAFLVWADGRQRSAPDFIRYQSSKTINSPIVTIIKPEDTLQLHQAKIQLRHEEITLAVIFINNLPIPLSLLGDVDTFEAKSRLNLGDGPVVT